ncbi:MAG: TIGR03936 family radical SAM-associated protein [Christensenella sp.]|nr:TIGR03936 family radical SAM-associated protein [Christensenella sp.]
MIEIVKHRKIGDLSYVSHKDTVDVLQRTLKRAKIDVNYSQGFVKHMVTYNTTPIPLGVQSICEYFIVDCNGVNAQEFLERFNNAVPDGLKANWSIEKKKNPNLAANVVASDYLIKCKNVVPSIIEEILDEDEYFIELLKKGEKIIKNVRPMLYSIYAEGKDLWIRSATGNDNLRIDSFVKHISNVYNIETTTNDIMRVNQLVKKGNKLISVEEYLNNEADSNN